MLTLAQKASIRRHLGVPAAGIATENTTMGLRAVMRAGQLEFYMNQLQVPEECILLGLPYAELLLTGSVVAGTVYAFTIGTFTVSYTAQTSDVTAADPLRSVYDNLLQQAQTTLISTYWVAGAVIRTFPNPYGLNPPPAQVAAINIRPLVGQTPFALTAVSNLAVSQDGSTLPSPSYQVSQTQVLYGYLPICDQLEQNLFTESQFLSISQVGSAALGQAVTRPNDLRLRDNLLQRARYSMGVYLAYYPPNRITGLNPTTFFNG